MLMPPLKRLTAINAPTTQKKRGGFIGNSQGTFAALAFDQGFLILVSYYKRWRQSIQRHALKRDAVHDAPVALVVVHGVVSCGAVVPKGNGVRLPMKAAGEFLACTMGVEQIQNRLRFLNSPVVKADGEIGINV